MLDPMATKRILFVDDGDAARSLMARGFARYYAGNMVELECAALDPKPPSSYLIWAMNETAVDISEDLAKPLRSLDLKSFDKVILLTDGRGDRLGIARDGPRVEEWPIVDVRRVRGQTADVIRSLRLIRYLIETKVHELLHGLLAAK